VVLAQAGKNTLIMDCDLRKPDMHGVFGLRNLHGIANALVDETDLPEVWQEPLPGLKVVTAGPLVHIPAELLSSRRCAELIGQMRERFDYVLIDTSPIGVVSDPLILANQADGVLLVLDAGKTREWALRESMRGLETVGANLLGTVMNNAKDDQTRYYDNIHGR
jgi:capsular exopolysaccharide synthesis family protein